jgi:arylsulfatase A-like enzyme
VRAVLPPTAPERAPNIVLMLVDDMGFSDIGPFGAEIDTPNLDRLAAAGVTMTNYHTAPVCSPARASLLTGVNPHRAGFSTVANFDPGFPGMTMELADDVLTLGEIFQENGYSTFAVGKWHLMREGLTHDAAPRRAWPTQRGFDRYYGCLEGFTSFMAPNRLVRDNSPVQVERYPDDYYLTDDLTDEAIGMIRTLRAHDAARPFFLYFAHHAVHAPHAAKPEDIAKYRGRNDEGWDRIREQRFARQKDLGLFPADTALPARDVDGPAHTPAAWDSVDSETRQRYARMMEVYAAMVDNIDQNLGRLLDVLEEQGELDNTIIMFTSDNGAARDGGETGSRSYFGNFLQNLNPPQDWVRDTAIPVEEEGGARAMLQYPKGWAMASNTPFRLYKGSTFAGGVRSPFVVHWPVGLPRGGPRSQYAYVTDVAPTLLEAAGLNLPTHRHGRVAKELDGTSFWPVLADAAAEPTRTQQYSEFFGQRGIYRDGWKLLTQHRPGTPFDDHEWQLFDVVADPTETTDLSGKHPELVRELAQTWEDEAWANTVFPLNDFRGHIGVERPSADLLSEPVTLYPGTPQLERHRSAQLIHLRSFRITVDVECAPGDSGVLVSHGDQGGGYVVFVEDGHVHLHYNEYGALRRLTGPSLPAGRHIIDLDARWLPGFRWDLDVSVDHGPAQRLEHVQMLVAFAPFTGIDVGIDRGGPVSWPLHQDHGCFPFSGRLHTVRYEPGESADFDPKLIFRIRQETAARAD